MMKGQAVRDVFGFNEMRSWGEHFRTIVSIWRVAGDLRRKEAVQTEPLFSSNDGEAMEIRPYISSCMRETEIIEQHCASLVNRFAKKLRINDCSYM